MKAKFCFSLFLFLVTLLPSMHSQIRNQVSNEGLDFDCVPCIERWKTGPKINILFNERVPSPRRCNASSQIYSVPGGIHSLRVAFEDLDLVKYEGTGCGDNPTGGVFRRTDPPNPVYELTFTITSNSSFASFSDSDPNVNEITVGSLPFRENPTFTSWGNSDALLYISDSWDQSVGPININVEIVELSTFDNINTQHAKSEIIDSPVSRQVFSFFYSSIDAPMAIEKVSTFSESSYTPYISGFSNGNIVYEDTKIYKYRAKSSCSSGNNTDFEGLSVRENLRDGEEMFELVDLDEAWATQNNIMGIQQALDILFPNGFAGEGFSFPICENESVLNSFKDEHGVIMPSEFWLLNTDNNMIPLLQIFKFNAFQNDKVGYKIFQDYLDQEGNIIGTNTIYRVFKKRFFGATQVYVWNIKKVHGICP